MAGSLKATLGVGLVGCPAKGSLDESAAAPGTLAGPEIAEPIEPGTGPAAFMGAFNSSSTGSGAAGFSGIIIGSVTPSPVGLTTGLTGGCTGAPVGRTTGFTGGVTGLGVSNPEAAKSGDTGATGVTGAAGATGATGAGLSNPPADIGSGATGAGASGAGVGVGVGVGLFIGSILFFLQNYV